MRQHKPASRLRRRLAATALVPVFLAGFGASAALAQGTVVIDSRGVSYAPEYGVVITGATGRQTRGSVTLDLSVLDAFSRAGPPPIKLTPPPSLVAAAPASSGPIKLRPPQGLVAAAPASAGPIKLRPPPYGRIPRRASAGAQLAAIAHPPPLPPRRDQLARLPAPRPAAPPPPSVAAPIGAADASAQGRLSRLPAAPRSGDANGKYVPVNTDPTRKRQYRPGDLIRLDVRRAPPPPTDLPAPPQPALTAPVLQSDDARAALARPPTAPPPTPVPTPERATAILPTPRVEAPRPALQSNGAVAATDDLKRKFPIIFERKDPPAMAASGWESAAPEAAERAADPAAGLPALASLAPPPAPIPRPPEPKSLDAALPAPARPEAVAATFARLDDLAGKPGDAVLAPPPPPARTPALQARPESAAALPEPEDKSVAAPPPRRALALPRALATVTPPGAPGAQVAGAPIELLPPPKPVNEAVAFAPRIGLDRPKPSGAPPSPASASGRQGDDMAAEIAFAGASGDLTADARRQLTGIVARAKQDPKIGIRLQGGAVADKARRARDLAIARALAVQRYLVSQGVRSDAIRVEPVTSDAVRDAVAVRLVDPA